ncbi:MAG: hypothetical protein AAB011_03400 [Candidatus Eisenbacteria bacterium]
MATTAPIAASREQVTRVGPRRLLLCYPEASGRNRLTPGTIIKTVGGIMVDDIECSRCGVPAEDACTCAAVGEELELGAVGKWAAGDYEGAIVLLERARLIYERAGDPESAEQMDGLLAILQVRR